MNSLHLNGTVGLGFRPQIAEELLYRHNCPIEFLEIHPENYMGLQKGPMFDHLAMAKERWPIITHGLSGDFAGASPIDHDYLMMLKKFLNYINAPWHSDHLSYTIINGVSTDNLLPLPLNAQAAERAIERIKYIQDYLELPIALENASVSYRMPGSDMTSIDFINYVLEEANCHMLLDINNTYVCSKNIDFDPQSFIDEIPLERVIQIHMAGHFFHEEVGTIIDTHGTPIIDPVYDLLSYTLNKMENVPPILLERDTNFPPLSDLENEAVRIKEIVNRFTKSP